MSWRARLQVALRQSLDRGRGLSAFLSRLSMAGLVLAVALLLAVMSVMNGFEREMRERILGLLPHVTVRGYAAEVDWLETRDQLATVSGVRSVSAFADVDVLLTRGDRVRASRLLGVEAVELDRYRRFIAPAGFVAGDDTLVLGAALARRLGLEPGDGITVVVPGTGAGDARLRRFTLGGVLRSGTEIDEVFSATTRAGLDALVGAGGGVSGLSLQLDDLFAAPRLRRDLDRSLDPVYYISDWTIAQGNLYAAIRLSRNIISVLLLSIIAVAAFNVVSSLVLVVTDRRRAIAMLAALGASRSDIQWIFLLQGGVIGCLGAALGSVLGVALALAAPQLARGIEWALGFQLLNTDVYPLAFLPVDIRAGDVGYVAGAAVVLCLLAAVVPARRAASLPVAELLVN